MRVVPVSDESYVNAFHEKAGQCQVGSCCFSLDMIFFRRAVTVATLPSALVDERLIARCKLGVLVSAGAATCLSTSLPLQGGSWARHSTQSPELGFWLCVACFLPALTYAAVGTSWLLLRRG